MEVLYDKWPVVYIKFNDIKLNDEIFEGYKVQFLNILKKCKDLNQKCLLILDLLSFKKYPIKYMLKQKKFHNKIRDFTLKYIQNIFVVIQNKGVRNLLKTFVNLSYKKQNYYFTKNIEETYDLIDKKFNIENDILQDNVVEVSR